MTIGFKNDSKEVMIEAPLNDKRNFMTVNNMFLFKNDEYKLTKQVYLRKIFETLNGKKLRQVLTQQFEIRKIHDDPAVKPVFVPLGASD